MDQDQKARAVADAMWAQDRASQAMGMRLVAVGAGTATLSMTVQPEHCNGFGILHGGLLAALADSAFAFACNSANALTVASGFDIDIVRSALVGDELTARAVAAHQGGRSGVYDVTVTRGHASTEELIAVFRGRATRLKDRFVVPQLEET